MWFLFIPNFTTLVVRKKLKLEGHSEPCSELKDLVNKAKFEIPLRCRLGDSHNLKIEIECSSETRRNPLRNLEIELQAAGMNVNGDLKQNQRLDVVSTSYLWNCNYSNAGKHIVNLIFREKDGFDNLVT